MRFFALLPLVTAGLILLLGVAVLIRERLSRISRLFMNLAAALSVWLICFSLMYATSDPQRGLFWAKAAFVGICTIPAAVFHFVVGLEHGERRLQTMIRAVWFGSALFITLILTTDQIVDGVEHYAWGFYPRYAWASGPYLLFFFFCLGAAMWHAYEAAKTAESETERQRMHAVMLSLAVGYVACFDYLPAFGIDVLPLGFLAITGFVLMMGYTVWRYELAEITDELTAPRVVRAMRGTVLIVDLRRRIRLVSEGAGRMLGYANGELIGRQLSVVCPALAEGVLNVFDPATVEFEGREYVWMSKSSEAVDVALTAAILSDRRGRPAGVVYTAEDISRRKREEALRESESRYRTLVENMNEGVMLVDLHGIIAFANQRMGDMLGYEVAELLGKPAATFVFRSGSAGTTAKLRSLRGKDIWVDVSEAPLIDGRGVRTGSIWVHTDITDRRRAEMAMRESEARYRLLAEHSIDMISRHTLDGRFLYASPASATILGYAPEELVGMRVSELMHPDDRSQIEELRTAMAGGSGTVTITARMRCKDGSFVSVETIWRPIADDHSRPAEFVAVSRDITDRKRADPVSAG